MWDSSSLTRDQTHAPQVEEQSFNYWTAREAPSVTALKAFYELAYWMLKISLHNHNYYDSILQNRKLSLSEVEETAIKPGQFNSTALHLLLELPFVQI